MDDNIDAEKILFALPLDGWKRPSGRPRITRLKTAQNGLKSHNLTLTEALDMAQKRRDAVFVLAKVTKLARQFLTCCNPLRLF